MKPGPSLRASLATLILGVALAVPAFVIVVVRAVRVITTPAVTTPSTTQRDLGAGTWLIYQETGTRNGNGFTFGQNSGVTLDPSQVQVTGPDGAAVAVEPTTAYDTITEGSRIFTAALQFHVNSSGRYTIAIDAPGQVLITRSLGHTFGTLIVPLIIVGVGGAVALTGLVLLIIGASRRGSAERAARPAAAGTWSPGFGTWSPGASPPGWYPDPQLPGAQRWWDGNGWTEHRH